MAINLPRYADDDTVDLVNGAYSQAMDEIERNLTKASTDSAAAKTKAEQAYTSAEQAKTSVLEQKSEIDKLRGDVDGLIAGGGEATVPIATTSKAGIVKPDGSTISVQVDGTVSLADQSVNSTKLAAAAVSEDKLSEGVKAKLNKPAVEPYTLPVATPQALGGVKSGGSVFVDPKSGIVFINEKVITEGKLSDDVAAKLNKTYTLPVATSDTLGGVKLGTLLSATEDGAVSLNNNSVTETKLSADVRAKLNKETGLTEVPDNSVTSAKIVNGAVTETKLSADVQAKLNKTAPAYSLPVATTTALGGVKSGGDINVGSTGTMTVGSAAVTTAKISDAAVTETKLSADVQAKLNKTAPSYSLPVASTSRLGGVKAGRDIDIDSSGLMTIGSGMIEESQLSSSVQNKLNKSGETLAAELIHINTTGFAGTNCHGFKFGDLIIMNIQARNLSGSSGIKIGSVTYDYTPRREMSGPCVCGNGMGQFVIRISGEIIINPKGYGPDGFFTCTYVV